MWRRFVVTVALFISERSASTCGEKLKGSNATSMLEVRSPCYTKKQKCAVGTAGKPLGVLESV